VVAAFENNGAGVRGDLKAVLKAVLLDPEARGDSKPQSFGRAQEWVLSVTKAMRYAQMERLYDTYEIKFFADMWTTGAPNILGEMGQVPMTPASVFNDYPFEYQVNGVEAPAGALWGAPQILANVGRMMSYSPELGQALSTSAAGEPCGKWQLTSLLEAYQSIVSTTIGTTAQKTTAAISALVDRVFADLNQGRPMTPTARSQTIAFIDIDCAALAPKEKLAWMVNFIRCLPESAVVI
jgi:hypothetical protein